MTGPTTAERGKANAGTAQQPRMGGTQGSPQDHPHAQEACAAIPGCPVSSATGAHKATPPNAKPNTQQWGLTQESCPLDATRGRVGGAFEGGQGLVELVGFTPKGAVFRGRGGWMGGDEAEWERGGY